MLGGFRTVPATLAHRPPQDVLALRAWGGSGGGRGGGAHPPSAPLCALLLVFASRAPMLLLAALLLPLPLRWWPFDATLQLAATALAGRGVLRLAAGSALSQLPALADLLGCLGAGLEALSPLMLPTPVTPPRLQPQALFVAALVWLQLLLGWLLPEYIRGLAWVHALAATPAPSHRHALPDQASAVAERSALGRQLLGFFCSWRRSWLVHAWACLAALPLLWAAVCTGVWRLEASTTA